MIAGRVIAIGDIHGCAQALATLLDVVEPRETDVVVPLGDLVDRGPDTRGVIERLMALADRCDLRPILGNHEEMMLSVLDGRAPDMWLQHGGIDTLDSYGFAGDLDVVPQSHRDFLESFADFVEIDTHFFVHGNYDAELELSDQPPRLLRWTSLKEEFPPPHRNGKKAVVGHTAHRDGEIFVHPHLTCIDTCCYGGGWLTGYDVVSGKWWQSNDEGEVREGQLVASGDEA